jgi:hypothetical protein
MDMHVPFKIATLADKALLVKLQRSMYQPYAFDLEATKLVEQSAGVAGVGRFNKRLFKGNTILADTNEKFTLLYNTYRRHTVPWLDDGVRMCPNALYFEFAQEMRGLIADAKHAADNLASRWSQMVQDDMHRLGSMANFRDYPTAAEVRAKFDATITFMPIPTTSDFRVDVTEEDKAEMERAIHEAEANVAKYLLKEMMDPVKAFVEKLSVPIGEKGSIFRDTLVENLEDLVTRLPRLNINNDPQVDAILKDIKHVVDNYGTDMEALRTSPITRKSARDKMAELDKKLANIMGY